MNVPTHKETGVRIAYFGGEPLGVAVLEKLAHAGIHPTLILCNPDRPVGRKQKLSPPPTKVWALDHGIAVLQPESLTDEAVQKKLHEAECDLFVVVAYGQIIPKVVLDIPRYGVVNAHPSLLPQFRGPNPIRAAILSDTRKTGVSVIKLDTQMDHGPILAQEVLPISTDEWPLRGTVLDARLAELSGALLAETIPAWVRGEIEPREQEHAQATYTHKLTKADGELALDITALPTGDAAYETLLRIRALDGWPGTYFFVDTDNRRLRVKIVDATLDENGTLKIHSVIPEGKREMPYADFMRSL